MKTEKKNERLYGLNPILEALRGNRPFDRIYISRERKGSGIKEIIRLARERRIDIRFTPKDIMDKMAQGITHQGILAFVSAKHYSSLEDVLRDARKKEEDPFIVLLDGIEDPRNLGALIRVAECGGVHGIILPERHSVGLTETVAKTSSGAIDHLPVVKVKNLQQTIDVLKKEGLWIVGADNKAKRSLFDLELDMPLTIVIGGEGRGLRKVISARCDLLLSIPMLGKTTSLNISVAAGVIIYEVLRQRLVNKRGSSGCPKMSF